MSKMESSDDDRMREDVLSEGSRNSAKSSSSSENEEDTIEQRSSIQSELRSMSFAELIKLKEKLGSKIYNEAMFGTGTSTEPEKRQKQQKEQFKRENKNRPREETAKKQVPLLGAKKSSKATTSAPRDPRFDENCGTFDRDRFKEDYSFVNEIREKEFNELKAELRKATDPEEKRKIKLLLQRMSNQKLEEKKLKERKSAEAKDRQTIKKAIKDDKKPFFVSAREKKAQDLVKQYLELKDSGKLNKHLEKRRKKNAARDRRKYNFD